jgi:hypothetical protein
MTQDDWIKELEDRAYDLGAGDWEFRHKHLTEKHLEEAITLWPDNTCWYCEVREPVEKFARSIQAEHIDTKTTGYNQYEKHSVKVEFKIPRCKECRTLMEKKILLKFLMFCSVIIVLLGLCIIPATISSLVEKQQDSGGSIITILFLITSIVVAAGFPAGYYFWRKKLKTEEKKIGLIPEKKESEFPVVQALKDHGWIITLMEGQKRI